MKVGKIWQNFRLIKACSNIALKSAKHFGNFSHKLDQLIYFDTLIFETLDVPR